MSSSSRPGPIDTLDDVAHGLEALLRHAPDLRSISDQAGPLPLRRRAPDFAALAHIVTGQQVSVASASAIYARLEKKISPLTAQNLERHTDEDLAGIGLSKPKIRTLRAVSEACLNGLDLENLPRCPADEAHAELCRIKGIGPWTADIFLLFCAGQPDIFPSGDLALRIAVGDALALGETPSSKDLDAIAVKWAPYRGIAARLFWAWYKVRKNGQETLPI
ncbi:DNA-3-methyladenine glycosylase family protein [Roseibium sp.]|uniref:DNA-3-methyladenine glycosylase family protein n=1 Tax=Roseibium sp. TaxID=1936156 RepID=UPI003A97635A